MTPDEVRAWCAAVRAWLDDVEKHPGNPILAKQLHSVRQIIMDTETNDLEVRTIIAALIAGYGKKLAACRKIDRLSGLVPPADEVYEDGSLRPSTEALRYANELVAALDGSLRERGRFGVAKIAAAIEAAATRGRPRDGAPKLAGAPFDDALRALDLPGNRDAIRKARSRARAKKKA